MMKRFFLVQVFIVASIITLWAQLKISSNGNVGIKLPNVSDTPVSPLSIGSVGDSNYVAYLTGSNKNTTLRVHNSIPNLLSYMAYGT
jgi:hypothetical protein